MTVAKIGSLIVLALRAFAADPDPMVTVVVTPNPVLESQSVQLRLEVEAAQSAVVYQPKFEASDFILVGSQPNYGGAPTRKYIGGRDVPVQKTYFEYVLSPRKTGNLTIRNIQVKVGDRTLHSPDLMVKVLPDPGSAGGSNPPTDDDESTNPASPSYAGGAPSQGISLPPEDYPGRFNSDFTVHASISKRTAYVGEPIVVEYWIYDYGDLRQMEVQRWPTFNGFWKEDLEITTRFEFEDFFHENELMRRAFIGRYALYGIKPGKLNLDKLVIRGRYVSNSVARGFFQVQQFRTGTHGSQELSVQILPLPEEGKPPKFGGAVGQFFLKAEADKTTVLQHQPVTFTLRLEGVGNFQAIDSIRLPLPPEFEVYESTTGARGSNPIGVRRELSSYKTFQVTAIPRKAGTFTVAPLEWWYFDPVEKRYRKATTAPLEIQVTENALGDQKANTYLGAGNASPAPESLRPLKAAGEGGFPWKLFLMGALGLAGLVNAWLLFGWLKPKAQGVVGELFRDHLQEAKAELAKAKSTKDSAWLSHLEDALYALAQVMLGSNPRGLTRHDLEAHWREQQLPAPLFHRIALLLDKLDQARFSSSKKESLSRSQLLKEAEDILKEAGSVRIERR